MPFALKKLITAFLLPPGIFVAFLFLSGLWLCLRRSARSGLFSMMLAVILWLVSTGPAADFLVEPLERGLTIPRPLRGDVIVVLGGGIHDKVPDLTGRGAPSGNTMARLATAVRAYRQLRVPIIVSGGRVGEEKTSEAEVDKRFLIDLGVPAGMVIVEDKSRDTHENAQRCRDILRRRGFGSPLLVTSAFHMRRSVVAFEKEGIRVTPLPAQFMTATEGHYDWLDLLPDAFALSASATALKEYIGLFYYRLTM